MEIKEQVNEENIFKDTLDKIKEYIKNLLKKKEQNIKDNVKNDVNDLLKNKKDEKSFFDKIKDKFSSNKKDEKNQ
jgi:hypothetical protein